MQFTQWALLLLVLSWTLQVMGSWVQWRHFQGAMREVTGRWSDGFLGVGRAKARFSAGAVALLCVDAGLRVRQLRTMQGLSVFARFRNDPNAEGASLGELAARYGVMNPHTPDTAVARAIRQAIAEIEEVRRRPR